MNYRKNPKNDDQLSILGYGCMRFPTIGGIVDEARAEKQIISAIEQGVNYFDTAYVYHLGQSESVLGKILAKGYRSRVKIATKMPHFLMHSTADMEKTFNTQLARLQTNYIDYYLIHMLQDINQWDRLKELGIIEWIAGKKAKGQIINIGFSYHGGKSQFIKLVDAYPWDFCQIQYNFVDENNQAGKSGLQHAAAKGIPVIVMEPLRGGKLASHLPKEVQGIWDNASPRRSAAEWALRWIWNHPEVTVVLSGMNREEQITENIRVASNAKAGTLTDADFALFDRVKEIFQQRVKVNCTGCGYCMPCPSGVDIPACFSAYNDKYLKNTKHSPKFMYIQNTGAITSNPGYASLCVKCGKCESHCPQSIPIRKQLSDVSREMEGLIFKPIIAIAKKLMRVK